MIDAGNGHQIELAYGSVDHFGVEAVDFWHDKFDSSDSYPWGGPGTESCSNVPYTYRHVESGTRPDDPEDPSGGQSAFEVEHRMVLVGMTVSHTRRTKTSPSQPTSTILTDLAYHCFIEDPDGGPTPNAEVLSLESLTVQGIAPHSELVCGEPLDPTVPTKDQKPCQDAGTLLNGQWVPYVSGESAGG